MKKGCKALVVKLNKYIDDELPASERQRIEKHLESCHECRQTLNELQLTDKMIKTAQSLPEIQVDVERSWQAFESRLNLSPTFQQQLERIWSQFKARFKKPIIWMPAALATAAVSLLLFLLPMQKVQVPVMISQVESVSVNSQTGQVWVMQTAMSGQPLVWITKMVDNEVG